MNVFQTKAKQTNERVPGKKILVTKAQGMVEFALVLPILLLLVFGLIEFARIFQAWLSITNASRFGLRYAVTGEYDSNRCQDLNNNGLFCKNETDRSTKNLEEDLARLESIKDVARSQAIGPVINDAADKGEPGWFKITVCSSREGYSYHPAPDDYCDPNDDPGNPEEGTTRVLVAVTYEHPLILPFLTSIVPSVTLHSERSGILEQFRAARVLGLPPVIRVPSITPDPTETFTATPSSTPTETSSPTPTSTNTPTPTETATPTATQTPTPTPPPSCDFLQINDAEQLYLSGDDLQVPLANTSPNYQILFNVASMQWGGGWHDQVDPLPGDQAFDLYSWNGANVLNVNDILLSSGASFVHPVIWTMNRSENGIFKLDFTKNYSSYYVYYHGSDFGVSLSYVVGDLDCSKSVSGRFGPRVQASVPAGSITGPFTVRAEASDPDPGGFINRIVFEVRDASNNVVYQFTDTEPPYCIHGNDSSTCNLVDPSKNWPGTNNPILNGNYSLYIQARDSDPHQQYTRIKHEFTFVLPPTPSPTITQTPGPATATRQPTQTPVSTSTPQFQTTPTRTPKPTRTLTPTATQPTRTPTRTLAPPTATPYPTATSAIPAPTRTRTPTMPPPTPTNTSTPCPGGGFDC